MRGYSRILFLNLVFGLLGLLAPQAGAQEYGYVDLYTLSTPAGVNSPQALGMTGNQIAGSGAVQGSRSEVVRALVWNGSGTAVDLTPANIPNVNNAVAYATDGAQQVGSGYFVNNGTYDAAGRALLWTGTADSAIDLSPSNYYWSRAVAVSNGQQVGYGNLTTSSLGQAFMWSGTASSAVQLGALTSYPASVALGTDGTYQVGYGFTSSQGPPYHALLWQGASAAAIDLTPMSLPAIVSSLAESVGGGEQVGYGDDAGNHAHALIWSGSGASAVDLTAGGPLFVASPQNPTPFTDAEAWATNGTQQVGQAFRLVNNISTLPSAVVWSATSDSAVDLQSVLPSNFTSSNAQSIGAEGDVFGWATDSAGNIHAMEWVPTPEPSVIAIAPLVCLLLRRRSRRSVPA